MNFLTTFKILSCSYCRPKDRYGNDLSTSKASVNINLCSADCISTPGNAALWITALNTATSTYFAVQIKYSGENVKLSEGQSQPIIAEISPLSDGSFQGRLTFPDAATYQVDVLLNQTSISGSPFEVMVFPESDDPDASQCTMEFTGPAANQNNTFPAGTILSVHLFPRNKYGVLLDSIDASKFNMFIQSYPSVPVIAGYDSTGIF